MMLLYAVVAPDTTAPDVPGLAGRQLEIIRGAAAAVIVEECPDGLNTTNHEAGSFAEIVCNLAQSASVLPVRFPTMLTTRSAVLAELQAHERVWAQRLRDLSGLSEVVIRAQWADAEPDSPSNTSGTSYLMSRAAAMQQREASVAEISGLIRDWAREIKVLRSQQGIRLACLVAGTDIPPLERAILRWQEAADRRQAVVSGPWPPFSFAVDQEAVHA
jgi:hypothetical protein